MSTSTSTGPAGTWIRLRFRIWTIVRLAQGFRTTLVPGCLGHMKALAKILAPLLISATIIAGTGTSAQAAAPIPFEVEGGVAFLTYPCIGFTYGDIVWTNRSASIDGEVHSPRKEPRCDEIIRSTTAFFEAYAGATKIDSTTRTVNYPGIRDFPGFSIGDPDLVGGINRIKIQVCDNLVIGGRVCGDPENYSRP